MIQVKAKKSIFSQFRTGLRVVIVAEIAVFLGSYGVWHRMNRDQEFRRVVHENFPSLLEGFYKLGELFDKKALAHIREVDLAVFESKKGK